MIYNGFQLWNDMLAPMRSVAQAALQWRPRAGALGQGPLADHMFAMLDMTANSHIRQERPAYHIDAVPCGDRLVAVREDVALHRPFGNLLHFAKVDGPQAQPRILVVAPLSGHFATLLRQTIATLLPDHDVYITDWANARDVPQEAGRFGFDEYMDYLVAFLAHIGPDTHVMAVCQPCVHALAATALMVEDQHPAQPKSLILMGGPVDTRIAPTAVNQLATSRPLSWFADHLISTVPERYAGAGRKVYPGFLQLGAFMSMNLSRHMAQQRALYTHLAQGRADDAEPIRDFYEEYCAVLDISAEFYLETVDQVFQRQLLPQGQLMHRGRPVRLDALVATGLFTIEGEKDDICAPGQTEAAHQLCTALPADYHRHYLQSDVGHYGLFSGSKWVRDIYPRVRQFILDMA